MSDVELIKITQYDVILLYNWFNSKDSIQFKIKTKNKISLKEHKIWFKNFIKDDAGFIWIIKYKNEKIGNIRLKKLQNKKYEIDIFIIKGFRGLKIASKSLMLAENSLDKGTVIYSYVKKNNFRSYRFFTKNNYTLFSCGKKIFFLKKRI